MLVRHAAAAGGFQAAPLMQAVSHRMTLEETQQAFELVAGMMSGEAGEAEECTCVHIYPSAAETGLRNRTTFD